MPKAIHAVTHVSPIADYEPPTFGGPPVLPPVISLRRRQVPVRPVPRTRAEEAHALAAATFADATLRRVLEVIDRRRPPAQLKPLLASGLTESLLRVGRRRDDGAARLRRVRAQPVNPEGTAAEVTASYTRGDRVHAVACRVEQVATPTGTRWQVVALHLG